MTQSRKSKSFRKRKTRKQRASRKQRAAGINLRRKNIVQTIQMRQNYIRLDPNYGLTNPYPHHNPHEDG